MQTVYINVQLCTCQMPYSKYLLDAVYSVIWYIARLNSKSIKTGIYWWNLQFHIEMENIDDFMVEFGI